MHLHYQFLNVVCGFVLGTVFGAILIALGLHYLTVMPILFATSIAFMWWVERRVYVFARETWLDMSTFSLGALVASWIVNEWIFASLHM
jgi:hypothetical protein